MTSAVECRDLHKVYDPKKKQPVHALRGLSLDIFPGECFGMLGPNGAGKTTSIEIMEGLLTATSGEVTILGRHWGGRDDDELRQRIGISLQETRLADRLTVRETLVLFRSFYRQGITPEEALEFVSLKEKSSAWVTKLSGGQKQRLAVACALVGKPDLLFLDEPTTGLDPQSRRQLWEVLARQREKGCTVLITTHYMDEAERLCDRVAIVDLGRVIALGTPRELIAQLGGQHIVEFAFENGGLSEDGVLSSLPSVTAAHRAADGYSLTVQEPHIAVPALLRHAAEKNLALARLTTRHTSLEDVFVSLTGRHLRDDQA